jgi:hypothetical protein
VNASNHGSRVWLKGALGIAVVAALAGAAQQVSRHFGVLAGAAVITAVFAACWITRNIRPLLHPARPARTCDPVVPSGNAAPDVRARDMLPVL